MSVVTSDFDASVSPRRSGILKLKHVTTLVINSMGVNKSSTSTVAIASNTGSNRNTNKRVELVSVPVLGIYYLAAASNTHENLSTDSSISVSNVDAYTPSHINTLTPSLINMTDAINTDPPADKNSSVDANDADSSGNSIFSTGASMYITGMDVSTSLHDNNAITTSTPTPTPTIDLKGATHHKLLADTASYKSTNKDSSTNEQSVTVGMKNLLIRTGILYYQHWHKNPQKSRIQ